MYKRTVSQLLFLLLAATTSFAQLDILRPSTADPTVNNASAAWDGNLNTSAWIQVIGQMPQPPVYFFSTTGNIAGFSVRQHNYTSVVLKYKCATVSQAGASFGPTETAFAYWAGSGTGSLNCDGNLDSLTLPSGVDTSSVYLNLTAVVEGGYMGAQGEGWVYLYEAWIEGSYPRSATTTTLSSSEAPAAAGASVTFTATVTSGATGTVTFSDGTTTLGTSSVGVGGQATLTTSSLAIGVHSITAAYSGDASYTPSTSSTLTQAIHGTHMTGYYPEWGPSGHYYVKNVVTSGSAPMLNVINYAFANVTNNACALADANADYEQKYTAANSVNGVADGTAVPGLYGSFHQLQELKSQFPNLKVLISLGGASLSSGFSSAAQPGNVAGLVASCIDMFINGNIAPGVSAPGLFDGIDINWEWPKAADTTNYVNMLALFRSQLDAVRPGLMLTIAGTPGSWATGAQPLSAIHPYLDYINIETYGYSGPWEKVTNFVAPLYGPVGSPTASHNIDATIQSYVAAGVPNSKLLMGFPFFAYDWTSVPNTNNGLYQTATPDPAGATYAHLVQIMPNFPEFRDPTSQEPYLFDGSTFWTFDDPTSIAFKTNYLKSQGLAGAMIWNLGQDAPAGTLIQALYSGIQ